MLEVIEGVLTLLCKVAACHRGRLCVFSLVRVKESARLGFVHQYNGKRMSARIIRSHPHLQVVSHAGRNQKVKTRAKKEEDTSQD